MSGADGEGRGLGGKVALVTGAAGGIGRATAAALAARGARVVVNDLRADACEAAAAAIGEAALAAPGDVASSAGVARIVESGIAAFGGIDILVNNAGVDQAAPILDITEADWDRLMAINAKSVFLVTKAVLPSMIARGGGAVVSLASLVARQGAMNGGIHYAASKGAILAFTRTLARQMAAHGIRANAVAPGVVDTELIAANMPADVRAKVTAAIPAGRLAEPAEVADAIAFLVSDEARYITGATLDVNGGFWMG